MRNEVRKWFRGMAIVLAAIAAGAAPRVVADAAFGGAGLAAPLGQASQATEVTPPNVVFIVTDDQRDDTLKYMDNVQRLLVNRGVLFTNGYVVNPVCCPSRASMMTGLYSHSTGVYTNKPHQPHGGFPAFDDDQTIATWLHDAGYRTGLFGKYLNGYGATTYVPPGWDRWFATFNGGGYYDYEAVSDGESVRFGDDPADYGTSVLRREARSFIRGTDAGQPIFLYFAPHAPHTPAIPAPGDRTEFSNLRAWRPLGFDERDVSDKPAHISRLPALDARAAREIDRFRRDQIRSLQSVDQAVEALIETQRRADRLENTMIVYTSDNGMFWGEHRLFGKSQIYEEAISVPFVIRYDALIERERRDDHLVLNIDLAPTFAKLAGVETPAVEGRSLLPLMRSREAPWRDAFLIEHLASGSYAAPTFCAIHTGRFVLVRYDTSEEELYDIVEDPAQLENLTGRASSNARREGLRTQLRQLCDPVPPGYTF